MTKNNAEITVESIFTVISIVLFILGIMTYNGTLEGSERILTTGVITEIRALSSTKDVPKYQYRVGYEVYGNSYTTSFNSDSTFNVGNEVDIYYDIDSPGEAGLSKHDPDYTVYCILSLIFFMIGAPGLIYKTYKMFVAKRLKENGTVVQATYLETHVNERLSINGKHPYRLTCEWINPEDGKKYIFKSGNIWKNPEKYIEKKGMTTLSVYINPKRIKQYSINIDEIFY